MRALRPRVAVTARGFRSTPSAVRLLEQGGLQIEPWLLDDDESDAAVTEEDLIEALRECQGVVLGAAPMTARVINTLPQLRVIARRGVGVDNVDLAAAREAGVQVTTTAGAVEAAVAEYVLALVLALYRRVLEGDASVRAGRWPALVGDSLEGSTLGIVGYGGIGRRVAELARALGMSVLVHHARPGIVEAPDLQTDLSTVLRAADVLTVHVPLRPETRGLIGEAELRQMRPSALLINTARGGIVDESALTKALRAGELRGAALDVFESEPPVGSPLLEMPNVILSPHVAGTTDRSKRLANESAARSVVSALAAGSKVLEGKV